MTGLPRDYSWVLPSTTGTRIVYGTVQESSRLNGGGRLIDTVGNRKGNNFFFLEKHTVVGGAITGFRGDGTGGVAIEWGGYPFGLPGPPEDISIASPMTDEEAAIKGFNLANPSRHSMNVISSAVELRDLPKMLRYGGRILSNPGFGREQLDALFRGGAEPSAKGLSKSQLKSLRRKHLDPNGQDGLSPVKALAAANLAWQFGWRPLISDINKLMNFQNSLARKRNEANRLYSGAGLRRRVVLFNEKKSAHRDYTYVESIGSSFIAVPVDYTEEYKIWVVVRFKPNSPSSLPPTDTQLALNMLGLDAHGLTAAAWELLPWSWLIDWCSNIGDIIQVSSNGMDCNWSMTTMRKHVKRATSGSATQPFPGGGAASASSQVVEDSFKSRYPDLPDALSALNVKLPILGNNQLSILGSIAMLRGGR